MSNLTLSKFTRLNESLSPEELSETELTRLENAVLDNETGHIKKRGGFARFNTNQVDSSDSVKSLHEVITSAGTNYLLAGINSKLRKSTDGTGSWSDVTSKGTPPYRMQAYEDQFIFTEGNVAPFVVTGDTLGDVFDLEITPMDVSGVTTGYASGGSLTANSFYMWVFCYITVTGELSPPSQPIMHRIGLASLGSTDGTNKRVGFKDLPASSDTRVVGIVAFRTQANSSLFYYHSQLPNLTFNWLDQKADTDLGIDGFDFINCPSASKYITLHKERIWHGNIKRNIKNFIMPALSNALAGFNATEYGLGGSVAMTASFETYLDKGTIAGTLAAGDYQYRFEFIDSEGFRSDPYDTNTVTLNGTTETSLRMFGFPYLLGNKSIVRCDAYRSKNGGTFYKTYSFDPNYIYSGAAFDSEFDQGLADGDAYVTNVISESSPCGLAFSEIGQPAHYPLENLRNIFPDDGDEITGIEDDNDGILIFKKNSICKIYTSGSPSNWWVKKLLANIGCSEPNSIGKEGNDYYFVHYNKIYKLNTSGGFEDIGETIKDTLATPTIYFRAATISKRWYILSISTSLTATLGQYLLVWDLMLKTWYKFDLIYLSLVLGIKQHGGNTGTILLANADYILYYGTGTVDTSTGSNVDIVPAVRTKTFKVPDGISLIRLTKNNCNYKKQDGKTLTITVGEPDSAVTNTFADAVDAANSSDWKTYEDRTKDTDSLKTTPKLYVQFSGAGLIELGTFRQEFYPVNRGKQSR